MLCETVDVERHASALGLLWTRKVHEQERRTFSFNVRVVSSESLKVA
jgi:hypothetical protein